jgi:thioesterase domain-containing protein
LRRQPDARGHEVEGFLDTSYFTDSQVAFMKGLFIACKVYTAKEYGGRVLLYAAQTQPLYHLLEVELAWAKIAPRLAVVPVPGTHESILREPYLHPLAESLREHLAEFRGAAGSAAAAPDEQSLESSRAETV